MCNSNVYIRFDGGEGTDDDEDFAETVTFQTLIPVVFILLAVLVHARRIMLLRRRSGVHVPFFTNTLRERPNVPAPQVISNVQSSQVLIPGQNGRKDTIIMFAPGAQPAPMAPQPREGPTNSSQTNYVTSQEAYYPSV